VLGRDFFGRATVTVARELVGCRLIVDRGTDAEVVAALVEVEAYLGLEDPASHAYRGPTPRAAIMFGPPGRLYIYFSYGMHHCANLVTEPDGSAGAVLLRAAAVESGEETVRHRRAAAPRRSSSPPRRIPATRLLSGPGNLCLGLALSLADNGADVCARHSRIAVLPAEHAPPVEAVARVGISRAAAWPLRFAWSGHPAVSV